MNMKLEELYKYIKENNVTNLKELDGTLKQSNSTIRRRLKALEEVGLIKLNRGGNIEVIKENYVSISDKYRKNINILAKEQIAKCAAMLVENDDVIFLDNGTTVRRMFKYLKNKDIKVYTNGYEHIEVAKKYNIDLRLIPGNILSTEASIVGEEAIMFLSEINFDRAFIGANGFHQTMGITTPHASERNLKKHALKMALNGYVLIDASKKDVVSKYKICEISEYEMIIK